MRAGEVFAGYQVERLLGSGGMGSVYLARHPRLPRLVALKVLSPEFAGDTEIRARFEREAELIARLDHPNIVSVSDRGVEGGRLWIAMQYIDGSDASGLTPPDLRPPHAVRVVAETAKALDYAHSVGVLHRDVKPANIMLARPTLGHDERVLLTDFGIGRLRDDTAHLTRTGTLTATLAYASPEQLSGHPLDQRSDQYSLACTLYWLLSGTTPFQSLTAAAVIAGHLHFAPAPVSSRRGGLPAALDVVFGRALAKNPADRFDTCRDFASAATRALTGLAPAPGSSSQPEITAPPTLIDPEFATPTPLLASDYSFTPAPRPDSGPGYPHAPTPPARSDPRIAETMFAGGPPDRIPPPGVPRPSADTAVAQSNTPPPSSAPAKTAVKRVLRGRWMAAGAAMLVTVLLAAAGTFWLTRDSKSPGGDSASTAGGGSAAPIELPISPGGGIQPLTRIDGQGNKVGPANSGLDPAGDGQAKCPPTSVAMAGALTGANSVLGQNVLGGVKLAVDQFTRNNPGCVITVKEYDTTGDPQVANRIAPTIVADPAIAALIGPVLSGETYATGKQFSDAGLPFLTPSATNIELSQRNWRTFFRGLAGDDFSGPAIGRYLAGPAGFGGVCVVWEASDYGIGLGKAVTTGLGAAADTNCSFALDPHGDIDAAVAKIATAGPDAVFYAGYYTESGPLLARLRAAAVTVPFISGSGSDDPGFVERAGAAATGATLSCACGPATDTDFATAYQALTGTSPGAYSAEAYDLTAIVLQGIAAGHTTHPALVAYLNAYSGDGLAQTYGWTATGEPARPHLWLYRVG